MKPALSIVFFTVASGAALSACSRSSACVALFDLPGGCRRRRRCRPAALAIVVSRWPGLASSTLHLANPRNAWRAYSRFRTSWLSRGGGVFDRALAVAAVFVTLLWLDVEGGREWLARLHRDRAVAL